MKNTVGPSAAKRSLNEHHPTDTFSESKKRLICLSPWIVGFAVYLLTGFSAGMYAIEIAMASGVPESEFVFRYMTAAMFVGGIFGGCAVLLCTAILKRKMGDWFRN